MVKNKEYTINEIEENFIKRENAIKLKLDEINERDKKIRKQE